MNFKARIAEDIVVNMTSKGQVLIPKAMRERAGLIPGQPVCVRTNEQGEISVSRADVRAGETPAQRKTRIRAALEALAGKYATGQSTDEIMRELRGDYEP